MTTVSQNSRVNECSYHRPNIEPLEPRTMLAVSFTPGPYAQPINHVDWEVGTIPGPNYWDLTNRINPQNPANVVHAGPGAIGLFNDAGINFIGPSFLPLPPDGIQSDSDSDLTFDADGRLFVSWPVRFANRRNTAVIEANPSTGAYLGDPVLLPNDIGLVDDKPFITADANRSSPFANNLYVIFTRFNLTPGEAEVVFSRSTDRGQSWSEPVMVSDFNGPNNIPNDSDDEGWCWASDVSVAGNGDVYVAYHAQPDLNDSEVEGATRLNPNGTSGKTFVLRSTDGGATFDSTAKVEAFPAGASDVTFNTQDAINGGAIAGTQFWTIGSATPYVLADPIRPGNVYVINADDPDNVHGSGDDADVVIARSSDNGATWTRSTVIAGPANSFQLFPTAAIDKFGNIALAWYDNRRGLTNSSGRFLMDCMATYSTDGGLTWAPEFRVNDRPFDPDPAAPVRFFGSPQTTIFGQYFGIDLFGGTAHVSFHGNRFSGPTAVSTQFMHDYFSIAGTLTVAGDDLGAGTADQIAVNPLPDNSDFIEVVVNGLREYATLREGFNALEIDARGGSDTISIRNTGVGLPITIVPSSDDDAVNVNVDPGAGKGPTIPAKVTFAQTQRIGALAIGNEGTATLSHTGGRVLSVTSLSINGSGQLDLADNDLIVDYSGATHLAAVQAMINSARAGGAWTGNGITSTSAKNANPKNTTLAAIEASDFKAIYGASALFAGQTIDATAVLVKYTYYGDADFNGVVNFDDYSRIDNGFSTNKSGWLNGDFDGTGSVNFDDYSLIDLAFNSQAGALRPGAAAAGAALAGGAKSGGVRAGV